MVKQKFSIKDLENLSGIKAHTIRIWEKRYDVLDPNRTETNIREYDLKSLQKLLNISFLNDNGYKISRISKMQNGDVEKLVNRISASKSDENRALSKFKLSMMNFDEKLFEDTYQSLMTDKDFRTIFNDVFLPLLNDIGILWQTSTINLCHEHFTTNLIKQKLLINLENLQNPGGYDDEKLFVLYLPPNEVHDLGLTYFQYEILLKGYKVINLGASLPLYDLENILDLHHNIIFVTYFTVYPEDVKAYLDEFEEVICKDKARDIWIMGRKHHNLDKTPFKDNFKFFDSVQHATSELQK